MTKRLRATLLGILTVLMFFSIAFGFVTWNVAKVKAEDSTGGWDGDLIVAGWGEPDDKVTPADYVLDSASNTLSIGSAAALAYFAHEVYVDTAHSLDGVTVKLTADIDLQNKMWIPIGQTDRSNTPTVRFSGIFDGQGHTISNLSTVDYYSNLKYNQTDKFYVEYTRMSDSKTAKIPFIAKDDEEYSYGLFGVASNITVKNLNVKGVSLNFAEMTYEGAPKKLLPDSMGAIIGYATGNVTVQNCVVGSSQATNRDLISATTDNNGSYGGLIGRIYAGTNNAGSAPYGDVEFDNCVNYIDIDYQGKSSKIAGIVGYAQFFMNCVIKNCVNYGDIDGGQFDGGITSYWSNQITDVNVGTQHFEITNCDNYGNISAVQEIGTNGRDTGGIIGQLRGADNNSAPNTNCPIEIKIAGCNNYGNISSEERVGGIISWYRNTAGIVADITNNYNFGNVYQYGNTTVGGYIGLFEVHRGSINRAGELTVSGGNIGTVYGTANVGSNFGRKSLTFNSVEHDRLTEIFYIDAGTEVVASSVDNIPQASTEHSKYICTRYDASVAVDDETFKYSGDDKKVIIGLADNVAVPTELVIPATVEKIGYAAFAGKTAISGVAFSERGVLTEIGGLAFAGTSVVSVALPNGLAKIGIAAFADCKSLNNVMLPDRAVNLDLGEKVFCGTRYVTGAAHGAYLLAPSSDEYKLLIADAKYAEYLDALTYAVDIEYIYDGNKIATEKKLRGQAYNVVLNLDNNKWDAAELNTVGPTAPDGVTYVWYDSLERDKVVTQVEDVSALLDGINNDKITLYAFTQMADGKVFIARNGIVYDKNKSYTCAELNALLYYSSDLITSSMKVSIKSFNDSVDNLPEVIHNAGKYTIEVVDGTDTYEFNITVERATMDLTNLDALEWNLVAIGDDKASARLVSSTLYIYTYATGAVGEEYPTSQLLAPEQIESLGLNAEYVTREVRYSVVRNRGKQVTVEIIGNGYTVEYEQQSNAKTKVGAYTACATLTADGNYTFTVGNISSLRGMTIEVGSDNTTATVVKKWYIVDLGNWLISQGGGEYSIGELVYGNGGNALDITAPTLAYTGTGGNITMRLYRNDTLIGSEEGFGVEDFAKYINRVMPAGEYRLEVDVEGVTSSEEIDSSLPENPEYADVYHNGFSETLRFTVKKADMPTLDALNAALKGKTFSFDIGNASLYDAAATEIVNAYLSVTANLDRSDTVWVNYDGLYGSFSIMYNLARWQSDEYRVTVDAASADTYTVYYKICAPNYYDSNENLANGETRYDYHFTLVKYEILNAPTVNNDGLVYTGLKNIPTLNETSIYHVEYDGNDDYTNAGEHTLYLVLNDSVHYRWKGVAAGETGLSVKYTITKAFNEFIEAPDIVRWVEGKFNKKENGFIGAAKFGTISYVITDTDDNVIYDLSKNIDKRADMKAGTYILKATVVGNDNYNGLTESFTIRILEKVGLPWWAVLLIVLGALLVAALVIFILWKKGVFQILTEKIVVAIRTKASVDATIASVRAAKRMEEGKQSVAEAKRRERIEEMRQKRAEQRALPPEERAAQLEERAKADEERAEKLRARSEAKRLKAAKMRGEVPPSETPKAERPQAEAAATDDTMTPTEE